MRTAGGKLLALLWSAILAFVILAFGQGVWGTLLVTNLKTNPTIPWSVPAMALMLWIMWKYLGGSWWPRSTSETRRQYLRARHVPGTVLAWAFAAGTLAIAALAGYWIVLFQLVRMPANALSDFSRYPPLTAALGVLMASLVSPMTEEAAFRGYGQVVLERQFSRVSAVLLSSFLFALAHLTQGAWLPKLAVYYLVGIVFGATANLTNSTLPALPVHIIR